VLLAAAAAGCRRGCVMLLSYLKIKKKQLAVVIESRACESRACVHVYTYWCSRHRQYCNTHEVTVCRGLAVLSVKLMQQQKKVVHHRRPQPYVVKLQSS
jgi:hypothetical protein